MPYHILVGSYTNSVYTLLFDPTSTPPSLTAVGSCEIGHHPSWIARHPVQKDLVIATLEQTDGKLVALKLDSNGQLNAVQSISSGGADPAHVEVLEEEIIAGNYSGSSILSIPFSASEPHMLPSSSKPMQFTGQGPNSDRQEKPHPHQVYHHPSREELLVPDLGADKVWRLLKSETGSGWINKGHVDFEPGHGPRHVVVIDDALYTVAELTSNLILHSLPPLPESPKLISTIPTLSSPPPNFTESGMLAAEILVAPESPLSPTLIYVSNRNDPSSLGDSIAIFSPATPTSAFAKIGEVRTGLNHLRGMAFGGEDNKWIVMGGANGGGIKVFERLQGGLELKEVASVAGQNVDKPTSFIWL